MLLNFKFENILSFKEMAEFSMLAPSTVVKQRFKENYVTLVSNYDVQKTAVIVGENAGGKSNFVKSMEYLRSFFAENKSVNARKDTINFNNIQSRCPLMCQTKQKFEIEISDEKDNVFMYQLVIDVRGIYNESLFVQEKKAGKRKMIMSVARMENSVECNELKCDSCKNESVRISNRYKIAVADVQLGKLVEKMNMNGKEMGLFVSKIALLGSEEAIRFLDIIMNDIETESYSINYDAYKTIFNEQEDLEILKDERYLEILRLVDYSIVGIEIDEEEPFQKTVIRREREDGTTFLRKIHQDSNGVKEFFAWAIQLFKVVYRNKIVIADEMDRVLNPVLSDRIIAFVNGKEHKGQFIFTSHNALHLDLRNYMKEQIYFITKDRETLDSELYSLADFPEIRYDTPKVYELYLKGILGGTASE